MTANKIIRIVVGSALIGYAIYSGIAWFYLGAILLITGIFNWCPMEKLMGTCDSKSGCCSSNNDKASSAACCSSQNSDKSESSESSCCSSSDQEKSDSACCTPKTDTTTAAATNITSFKPVQTSKDGTTLIEILGTGCSKCIALEQVINETVKSLDGEYEVKKVSDVEEIMKYQVLSTPGLVINGTVVSTGKVLSIDEVKNILQS